MSRALLLSACWNRRKRRNRRRGRIGAGADPQPGPGGIEPSAIDVDGLEQPGDCLVTHWRLDVSKSQTKRVIIYYRRRQLFRKREIHLGWLLAVWLEITDALYLVRPETALDLIRTALGPGHI